MTTRNDDTRFQIGGPDAVRLTVCNSCARTDRYAKLTARHYKQGGGWCPGPVEEVLYIRARSLPKQQLHCEWVNDDPTGNEFHGPRWCGATWDYTTLTDQDPGHWQCPACETVRELP